MSFSFKSFIAGIFVALLCLTGLYFFAEYKAKKFLIGAGIVSDNGLVNAAPYGRVINLYSVSENTPNFKFSAYDEHFHSAPASTDSNGFVIGDDPGASLAKKKEPGTIRIFLLGGSAAFGSIQTRSIIPDSSYPSGTYTYGASICGSLKKILAGKYPSLKFEIVNAAVVMHQFHQGYTMYLEKIHDFHPDIVINLDFQNDLRVFNDLSLGGDPYKSLDQVTEQLNIEMLKRCPRSPYLSLWWNAKNLDKNSSSSSQISLEKNKHLSTDTSRLRYDESDKSYDLIHPFITRNMQKMLWLINAYERQMQDDHVLSIFCIQPLLVRREAQKPLSPLELNLRSVFEKKNSFHVNTIADSVAIQPYIDSYSQQLPSDLLAALDRIGCNKFKLPDYIARTFEDYLSPAVDSIVSSHDGRFIDMGKQMKNISADHEFYVDYCHMTPYGNQFVAAQMASAMDDFLKQKELKRRNKGVALATR